jgi:hypothetical protein
MKSLSSKYIFLIFLSLAFVSCNSKKTADDSQRSVSERTVVKTEKVKNSSAESSVTALGIVMSENEARPSLKPAASFKKRMSKKEILSKKVNF